jgi:hypothetical protein
VSVIEFPSDKPPELVREIASREATNSAGFLRLEEPVREAALMAEIVDGLIRNDDFVDAVEEHTMWAILRFCEMVKSLRNVYRETDGGAA